ncbi:arylsulfatase K isoform X1 [Danio rerio]|uniref:Arylsulfatase K n=4 Tax=Danio rerio TaxID=7955 RepID=ARSK_DANRE|nr:arylsulfatase K precursor [Danio rerio]Q08CJ7.1 RecName: Full=Arylsulfatase K; Short=ASK; AltName: Full=Glucuronate-2-sulfatase; Flags: Precursor [Danio rerio]AAI24213.1 Zgc:153019 [Danio rerio]|eukprot:NP_001070625.1 arylsulfatase K precursor [Danio rerio]
MLRVFVLLIFNVNAYCMYLNWTSHDRPNIVMIMSDAFDGRLTFQPGNKVVQLPYINYMRELGSVFLNSYTNSPICCPSRAAMWSGQFVHLTQSWNNNKCLHPNATTWMDDLRKSGYHTHSMGKLDYTSGHHSVSNRVEAWTRDVPFLLRQEGRPVTDLVGDASTKRVMIKDWTITDAAVQWIRNTTASLTQPFALYLGLNLPHPYRTDSLGPTAGGSTFRTSPYWLNKVSYNQVSVPKWLRFKDMHPVDYYSTVTKNCSGHFTEEEIRNIRAFYYAMCAETDGMLGEVMAALRDTGSLNKTVVLFTSDHGDLAMEHRQFYKMSMFEGSSHVPLLIMGPGVKSGFEVSLPVSLVDIYPTVLDLAGVPQTGGLSGHSLIPLISRVSIHSAEPHPAWAFSEYHGCNANTSTYMLRIAEWKYIAYADGLNVPPQLFNLSKDESELRNIASQFPDVCQDLDKLLRSIVDYPSVSKSVHRYNKQQFLEWKQSLGDSYSQVIASLRWHVDWKKDAKSYERDIDEWLLGLD